MTEKEGLQEAFGTDTEQLLQEFARQKAPCPDCGKMSAIRPVPNQDPNEQVPVDVIIACPDCGKFTVRTRIAADGDTGATVLETGAAYEPSTDVREAKRRIAEAQQSKTYKSEEERELDILDAKALITAVYDSTGRSAAAEKLSAEITESYRKLAAADWTPTARDRCLKQAGNTATFKLARGDAVGALKVYDDTAPLAAGLDTAAAVAFSVSRAFLTALAGKRAEAVPMMEKAVAKAEKICAAGRPAEDPYLLAVAYNTYGIVLADNGDREGSLSQLQKAVAERLKLLGTAEITVQRLRDYVDCNRSLAEAYLGLGRMKDATKTLNQAIMTAGKYPDYPAAYADALMSRAKYLQMTAPRLPSFFRDDMTTVIRILSVPQTDGSYDRLLAVAYLYRSWTCPEDAGTTAADLGRAYDLMYAQLIEGGRPDSTFVMVAHNYLSLLNRIDKGQATRVRGELRQIGISPKMLSDAINAMNRVQPGPASKH
ncbi:MAG: hypothetical protein WCQ63_00280 [Methanomethylophilus sp.]